MEPIGLPHSPEERIVMRSYLSWIRSNPTALRQGMLALVMVGATVAAFYWGRMGVASRVDAQQVPSSVTQGGQPVQPVSDYSRRVVAYLYDNMPISREELGE